MAYPIIQVVTMKDKFLSKNGIKSYDNKRSSYRPRFKQGVSNRIPMKRSPYLGYLRHAPSQRHQRRHRSFSLDNSTNTYFKSYKLDPILMVEKTSPYVGFMRHAPPSNGKVRNKSGSSVKVNKTYNKHEDYNSSDDLVSIRYQQLSKLISGRLPGGGNLNSYYSMCRFFMETDTSSSRSHPTHNNNQDNNAFEMFHRLASWFLFPVAYDQRSFCSLQEIADDTLYMEYVRQGYSLILSLIKRFLPGREGLLICTGLNMDDDPLVSSPSGVAINHSCRLQSNASLSSSLETIVDLLTEAFDDDQQIDDGDRNNSGNHPISSMAKAYHLQQAQSEFIDTMSSEEIQRNLDIESILKLPIITYVSPKREDEISQKLPQTESKEKIEGANLDNEINDSKLSLEWSWISVPLNPQHECSSENESDDVMVDTGMPTIEEESNNDQEQDYHNEKCVICLEQFKDGDRLRVLPCEHRFHTSCIDKWLSGSYSYENCFTCLCPTCKKEPNIGMISNTSSFEVDEDDSLGTMDDDMRVEGIVPSWAFARLGGNIVNES